MDSYSAVYFGNIEKPKNHFHETFLAYFDLLWKRHHLTFTGFDKITILKYGLFRKYAKKKFTFFDKV